MKCPNCGCEIGTGSQMCPYCGSVVPQRTGAFYGAETQPAYRGGFPEHLLREIYEQLRRGNLYRLALMLLLVGGLILEVILLIAMVSSA